jgi:phosphoglycerol transferase MdoB-like AlkP superfamily enzyme
MAKLDSGLLGQFKAAGYTTYLISANTAWITSRSGFKADYEYLIDMFTERIVKSATSQRKLERYIEYIKRKVYMLPKYLSEKYVLRKGGRKILEILDKIKLNEPYFLFINVMEAHDPYTKKDLNVRKMRHYIAEWLATGKVNTEGLYLWKNYPQHAKAATEIALEIIRRIKQKGDWHNTLIIVTSDHGELLGDGGFHHVYSLLDGNIKVPLYVKYPTKPKKQQGYISLKDIPRIIDQQTEVVGNKTILAETYGVFSMEFIRTTAPFEINRFFHHKIRFISKNYDFIYNIYTKTIEKIFHGDIREINSILKNCCADVV